MDYLHGIMSGHIEWALAFSLLVSALPDQVLLILMRGFGRRGFGFGRRRGFRFGPRLGVFRLIRILFVLLFTTILGPIVLVLLVILLAYGIYNNRRR